MKLPSAIAVLCLTFASSAFSMPTNNPEEAYKQALGQTIFDGVYDFDDFTELKGAQAPAHTEQTKQMSAKEMEYIKSRHAQMEGRMQGGAMMPMNPMGRMNAMPPMQAMPSMAPAPMGLVVMQTPPPPPAITTLSVEGLAKIAKPSKKDKTSDDAASVNKRFTDATLSAIDQVRLVAEETAKKLGGEYRILHLDTEEDGDHIRAQGKIVIIKKN